MRQELLLLEDVDGLGRRGDVVKNAKPGFIRNFLLPQKKAVIADKHTLKLRERLQKEREQQAAVDRTEAEAYAKQLAEITIEAIVKIDPDGKMYGSVTSLEIAGLLKDKGIEIERKNVLLPAPIKNLGTHTINLRLKESVPAAVTLQVIPETPLPEKKTEEPKTEESKETEAQEQE